MEASFTQLTDKKSRLNGIILGLLLGTDMLTKIISSVVVISNNMVIIYFSLLVSCFIVNGFRFNIKYLISFFIFLTMILLSLWRTNVPTYTLQYLTFFICYFGIVGYSLQFEFDIKTIFKTVNIVNIFFLFYLLASVIPAYKSGSLNLDYTMDLSYTALIGIFSYFSYYFLLNEKKKTLFFMANSFALIFELYFIIVISYNRGSLLSLGIFMILVFLRKIKSLFKRISILSLMFVIAYLLYKNLINIMIFANNFLMYKMNIQLNWLHKSIFSLGQQNLDSGRDILYMDAMKYFKEAPIVGNGIGDYASRHLGQYPHNLFLEALTDQGLFITIILAVFCIYALLKIVISNPSNELTLFLFLFCLSIPRLLISSSIWYSSFFWALVVICIISQNKKRTKSSLLAIE